ncbi:VCBS repeat-containing protein [Streptosporangium sp. NPDC020145]|uniref:FG-GAP repeat domain-containing protein n=1 Tax=Streptosporangium sp. NPDC020145 TaxID=3154694 RepID=UPI00342989A7
MTEVRPGATSRDTADAVPPVRPAALVALAAVAVGWALTGTAEPPAPSPTTPVFSFAADRLGGSATGVALFDLDGEIVSDDVCLADPRHGGVTVAPVPGTHGGYRPFRLTAPGPRGVPVGCLPADLDEDGAQDLVVLYRDRSPSLFVRLPGTRPSATAFAHREPAVRPGPWNTAAASVGDFDGDGHLDLVLAAGTTSGGSSPDVHDDGPRLYLGTGTGTFTEAPQAFGEAGRTGGTLALGTRDLDGDGLPELYLANGLGPDTLLVNESAPGRAAFRVASGTRDLTTPRSSVLGRDSSDSGAVAFTDLDADGAQDILIGRGPDEIGPVFVSTVLPGLREHLHEGEAPYEDRAGELGLGRTGRVWDVETADLDNDGHDEIMYAVAAPGGVTLFTPGADGRHTNVAGPVPPGGDATALAVGDVDDDGRLDVAVSGPLTPATLYRNHGVTAPFVGLRPRLPAGPCGAAHGAAGVTRPAIGAEARLRLPDGGTLAGQLYPAASAPELLLGLGETDTGEAALPVALSWRDECGVPRTATVSLDPGWHDLLLTPQGVSELRNP